MKRNAFTLIEALISLGIIAILSSLLVANYKTSDKYSSLSNFQSSLVSDLEIIKWKALNSDTYDTQVPVYWGIYLSESLSSYQVFADLNGDMLFSSDETNSYFGAKEYSSTNVFISTITTDCVGDLGEVVILFPAGSSFPIFYDPIGDLIIDISCNLVVELSLIDFNVSKLVIVNQFGLNDAEDCFCEDANKYCCSFCPSGSSCSPLF